MPPVDIYSSKHLLTKWFKVLTKLSYQQSYVEQCKDKIRSVPSILPANYKQTQK